MNTRWLTISNATAIFLLLGASFSASASNAEAVHLLTNKQIAQYKAGLSDPYVVAIRTFLNNCLKKAPAQNVRGDCTLLKPFKKSDLGGKFIVYWVQGHLGGGIQIAILFQDHPNQIITVWLSAPDQKTFLIRQVSLTPFSPERLEEIRESFRNIIKDPSMGV